MVLTGLRKNLVVKEILNTGIIHSMQKVLEVILEDQQYLEMARILTAEVNLFLYQTENNSYPHLHRHYTLTYQKARRHCLLKSQNKSRCMQMEYSAKHGVEIRKQVRQHLTRLRMFGSTLQRLKNLLKK